MGWCVYTQAPGGKGEALGPDANTPGGPPLPSQHGVQQDSQAPDIARRVVALPLQDLEGQRARSEFHWAAPVQSEWETGRAGPSARSASAAYHVVAWPLQRRGGAQPLPDTWRDGRSPAFPSTC